MSVIDPDNYPYLNPEDDHIHVVVNKFIRAFQESDKVKFENMRKEVCEKIMELTGRVQAVEKSVEEIDKVWTNEKSGRMPQVWSVMDKGKTWLIGLALLMIANIALSITRGMFDVRMSKAAEAQITESVKEAVKEAITQ